MTTTTLMCDWASCGRDAEHEGRCRYHHGRTKPAAPEQRELPPTAATSQVSHPCTVNGCKGRTRHPGDLCSWHRQNGTPDRITTDVPDPHVEVAAEHADQEPDVEALEAELVANGAIKQPETEEEPPVTESVWGRDNIIAAIQAFHDEHGRAPRQTELRVANGLPSQNAITTNFGNMSDCFKAAGLEGPGRSRRAPASKPGPAVPKPPLIPAPQADAPAPTGATGGDSTQPSATDDKTGRLATLHTAIVARREELLDLQAEALNLLDEIREDIG